jgi:predicted N-acetyltransferase YhbS
VRRTVVTERALVIELVQSALSDDTRDASERDRNRHPGIRRRSEPIDLVAVEDDAIVGHVLGARGDLGGRGVIGVTPLAVAPAHQRRGIGTSLMLELLQIADAVRWPMAVSRSSRRRL